MSNRECLIALEKVLLVSNGPCFSIGMTTEEWLSAVKGRLCRTGIHDMLVEDACLFRIVGDGSFDFIEYVHDASLAT